MTGVIRSGPSVCTRQSDWGTVPTYKLHPPTTRLVAACGAALVIAAATTVPAEASEGPAPAPIGVYVEGPTAPDTGGWDADVTAPEDRLPETPEVKAKIRTALQSLATTSGVSSAVRAQATAELAERGGSVLTNPVRKGAGVGATVAAPTSRTIGIVYTGQQKSYYCGPASAYMILRQRSIVASRDGRGLPLTQSSLATNFLYTERDQETSWASQNMANGINTFSGWDWGYYQAQSPSVATVQGAFTSTVGTNGRLLAADTVEFLNGAHYNGHPNKTIGHWLVGYGYAGSGATTYWADPSTTFYPNASQTFSAATASFTSTYLQTNGIMY